MNAGDNLLFLFTWLYCRLAVSLVPFIEEHSVVCFHFILIFISITIILLNSKLLKF